MTNQPSPPPTSRGESNFEIFGNYILLKRISQGGMAAIFLARPASAEANGRLLALKRILPQIAHEQEFIDMFRSEIQLSMGLNHPNIVQTYDFAQTDRQPYIAMEFIEGKNVRQIINQYAKWEQTVPVEIAVSIAAQAAAGLNYAHTFKDRVSGKDLNVIHRDVSPQNILITYDGNVKLIDFGIAKAENDRASLTRTGVVKGKVCYLSPEQTLCEPLDARSDIFSLCTVFWEMLAGQKLFSMVGRSDEETMLMVRDCESHVRPPSTVNPKVPPELDVIVLKGLRQNPRDRYSNAGELQKALREFLQKYFPGFGYLEVGNSLKTIFKDEYNEERQAIQRLNTRAQDLLEEGGETSLVTESPPAVPRFLGQASESSYSGLSVGTNISSLGSPVATPSPFPGLPGTAQTPSYLAVAGPGGQGIAYMPMGDAMAAGMVGSMAGNLAQPATALRFPSITRARLLYLLLILSTIQLIRTDQEYLLFQRFFMPTDAVRLASQGFKEIPLTGNRPVPHPAAEPPSQPVAANSVTPAVAPVTSSASSQAITPSVLLNVEVTPARSRYRTYIRVNGTLINSQSPFVRVQAGRTVMVQVDRKGHETYRGQFVVRIPQGNSPSQTLTLPIRLKPSSRR